MPDERAGAGRRGIDDRAAPAPPARCPQCGQDVPVMEALVYHGLVYHPACVVAPSQRERADAARPRGLPGVPDAGRAGDPDQRPGL